MRFMDIIEKASRIIWGPPLIILLIATALFLTIRSGCFQFRHFGWIIKQTLGKMGSESKGHGTVSAWKATMVAIGAAVGTGNIAGTSTAIALGGPGALVWMWIVAFLGMITKMAEVSLALYYREQDDLDGMYTGGPTYYMEKGLGKEHGWGKFYKVFALIFGVGVGINFIFTITCYNSAEALNATFGINLTLTGVIYTVLSGIVIIGGFKRIAHVLSRMVPIMCVVYVFMGLVIIGMNITSLPSAIEIIFKGAFTGTAAAGGFAGAAVSTVISQGCKRALYSNEAGWGTSPMIHAASTAEHPVEQGIWGAFEVFVDTMIICSITAFVVIITGVWDSGSAGATLALEAFETGFGYWAKLFVCLALLIFAFTTTTGSFTHVDILLRHGLKNFRYRKELFRLLRFLAIFPPGIVTVLADHYDVTSGQIWSLVDIATGIPTFVNLITLIILSGKFVLLLKDYEARYMKIGETDPKFVFWYSQVKEHQTADR